MCDRALQVTDHDHAHSHTEVAAHAHEHSHGAPAVAIAALIVGIVALLVASAALWTALRTRPAIAVVKDVPMQRATNFGSEDVAARAQA